VGFKVCPRLIALIKIYFLSAHPGRQTDAKKIVIKIPITVA
jgi:hypothetical protein